MRAITGAVVSSEPCNLKTAHKFLTEFCSTPDSYLANSDCATYVLTLGDAIREQHNFLRRRGRLEQQQGAAYFDAHGYEGLVESARERQGGEKNQDSEIPAGGPHGSVEEVKVAVAAGEKKSRKRKKEEEPQEDKAVAGVGSHTPASPEILSEQRKKKKEKHSSKELVNVVKQEPDLVVEEHGGSEKKKKKKEKHSDKELASIVKQEPGLVVEEELGSEKKKGKKKKEKDHAKPEEDVVEVKGQIVNNGVADQGIAVGEKKRKKKKHSEEEGDSKGVKEEEKMATDSDLNSEKKKKKKKRGRGHDDDNVQEQGEHKKKKQRKES